MPLIEKKSNINTKWNMAKTLHQALNNLILLSSNSKWKSKTDFSHFLANYVQKVNQQLLSGQYPLEISGNFQAISCSSKWDGMLCWPPTLLNTTVAIPCNASKIFVETLQETIETVQKELIPGEPFSLHFN